MDQSSFSQADSRTTSSTTIRRRVWTMNEEKTLIVALEMIIEAGWRNQNGFRGGYLGELEKHMRHLIPGCDLRADPHIHSKIHSWTKDYQVLWKIMRISGFSWDVSTGRIIVDDDDVWNAFVREDVNAKRMHHKSYPWYGKWLEIFGCDRATGQHAEDIYDANKQQMPAEEAPDKENVDVSKWKCQHKYSQRGNYSF